MTISINAGKTLGSFGSLGDATDAQEAAKHDKRKPVHYSWKEKFNSLSRFLNWKECWKRQKQRRR